MPKKRKALGRGLKAGQSVELRGVYGRSKLLKAAKQIELKRRRILTLIDAKLPCEPLEKPEKTADPSGRAADPKAKAQLFRQLRALALKPEGFCSHDLRKRIWPFLLASSPALSRSCVHESPQKHRDDDQVLKDVDRSMAHFDVVAGIKTSERNAKRRALTNIIHATLRRNDQLYYYQGYHDVCSVFLLVLGSFPQALPLVVKVSETYHRESMRNSFESVLKANRLLFPLLQTQDQELYDHLMASQMEPFFALPWLITWFSHQLFQLDAVARLFDVLLCSHPLMSLYLSASLVLQHRERVLRCESDFGTLHQLLAKLPTSMDLEKTICHGEVLLQTVGPVELCQLGQLESALQTSMYFQFPFDFQQEFDIPRITLQLDATRLAASSIPGNKQTMWKFLSVGSWLVAVLVLLVATAWTIHFGSPSTRARWSRVLDLVTTTG